MSIAQLSISQRRRPPLGSRTWLTKLMSQEPNKSKWYSLAGEMELGREPILSKNCDEHIGICPCTTNIPCGCDYLVHWRRGKNRRQAQKETQNPIITILNKGQIHTNSAARPKTHCQRQTLLGESRPASFCLGKTPKGWVCSFPQWLCLWQEHWVPSTVLLKLAWLIANAIPGQDVSTWALAEGESI